MSSDLYSAEYYADYAGERYERSPRWLTFFDDIGRQIVETLNPATVLDAGCAMGMLVEVLRDRGVDADGFDLSGFALSQARADIRDHVWKASLTDPLERDYDLVTCVEVLEHVPPAETAAAVANLCAHAQMVLFSSTPDGWGEATHFNVQPPEYWVEIFARNGFLRDVDYDAAFLAPWAILFRKTAEPLPRVVRDYERFSARFYRENRALRDSLINTTEQVAAAQAEIDKIRRRLAQVEPDLAIAEAAADELRRQRETASYRAARRGQEIALKALPPESRRGRFLRGAVHRLVR